MDSYAGDTGHLMCLSSSNNENNRKSKYRKKRTPPKRFVSSHLLWATQATTISNIIASKKTEQNKPFDSTFTVSPKLIAVAIAQGKGKLKPIADD